MDRLLRKQTVIGSPLATQPCSGRGMVPKGRLQLVEAGSDGQGGVG